MDEDFDLPDVLDADGAPEALMKSVLRAPEVLDALSDAVELGADALLDNRLAAQIPVVGWARALVRGVHEFRDWQTLRKLRALLLELDVSEEERSRWSERLKDQRELRKIGELVTIVVDRATSTVKAEMVGRALRRYLGGECDSPTLIRTIEMIDNALTSDLLMVAGGQPEDVAAVRRLLAVGLLVDHTATLLVSDPPPPEITIEASLLRSSDSARAEAHRYDGR